MLIHFAFGNLRDSPIEQAEKTIEHILIKKQLKVSTCEEFLPILHYPQKGSYYPTREQIVVENNEIRFKIVSVGLKRIDLQPEDKKRVHYIPQQVPMICFTKKPFSKLKNSPLHQTYGKFGIVFQNGFSKKMNIRPVVYYTESSLFLEPQIIRYNHIMKENANRKKDEVYRSEIERLTKEITCYRKPASLYPNFHESFVIHATRTTKEAPLNVTFQVYDRYPLNYNFTDEDECRLALDKNISINFLSFKESDIYAIIVPNEVIKQKIDIFLKDHYKLPVKTILHPIQDR